MSQEGGPPRVELTEGQVAARHAGIYIYSRVAAGIIDALAFILAARLFPRGVDGYEFIAFTWMVLYLTAIPIGSLGLPEAVFYFLGRRPGEGGAVVRQTSFLLTLAIVPVALAVGLVIFLGSHTVDLRGSIHWVVVIIALELPTQPAVNLLISEGQARLASALYVVFSAARAAAVIVPAVMGLEARTVLYFLFAAGALRLAIHLWILRRFFPIRGIWLRGREMAAILKFALPAGFAAMCGSLNAQIDKYFVAFVLGATALGDYSVGSWELPMITLLPYAIGSILQPRYVRLHAAGEREALVSLWHSTVRKTTLLVVPLAIAMIVLASDFIVVLFSAKFERAVLPFQIYTVILLHRVASYGAILQAVGDTRALLVASSLLIGTNLVVNYPLLLWLGFPGAALATLFSVVPAFAYTLHRICRGLGVPLREVMPWRAYFTTLVAAAALGGLLWAAREVVALPAWANLAFGLPLYLAAAFALGRALGLVRREDVDYLRGWFMLKLLREE